MLPALEAPLCEPREHTHFSWHLTHLLEKSLQLTDLVGIGHMPAGTWLDKSVGLQHVLHSGSLRQGMLGQSQHTSILVALLRSIDCTVAASVYLIICPLSSQYNFRPSNKRTKTKYNLVFLFQASLFSNTLYTAHNNIPKALETPTQRLLLVPCFAQSQNCFMPCRGLPNLPQQLLWQLLFIFALTPSVVFPAHSGALVTPIAPQSPLARL